VICSRLFPGFTCPVKIILVGDGGGGGALCLNGALPCVAGGGGVSVARVPERFADHVCHAFPMPLL